MTQTPNETGEWVPGEVPPPDEVSAPFWEATAQHRLTIQRCSACGHTQHPPRAVCTGCSSMDHLEQTDASGAGTIDSHTTIHRAPRPGVVAPYTIARVRLAEGPILLTRLEPVDGWAIGDPVTVDFVDLPDDRALPFFRPAHPEEPR